MKREMDLPIDTGRVKSICKDFYTGTKISTNIWKYAIDNFSIKDNIIINVGFNIYFVNNFISSLLLHHTIDLKNYIEYQIFPYRRILELSFSYLEVDENDRMSYNNLIQIETLIFRETKSPEHKYLQENLDSVLGERIATKKNTIIIFYHQNPERQISHEFLSYFKIVDLASINKGGIKVSKQKIKETSKKSIINKINEINEKLNYNY